MRRHKNNESISLIVTLILLTLMSMCGCTQNNDIVSKDFTDNEKEEFCFEIELFLEDGGYSDELKYFEPSISINEDDIYDNGLGAADTRYYFSNSAIYLQVDDSMYRFQLNKKNKIQSYIKYNLEG